MTLTTDRLILRPFRDSDFETVHAYGSDLDVTRYTSFGPNSPEETREFISRCQAETDVSPRQHYNFAITLRDEDRVIGGVGFNIDQPRHDGAEMGYVLHHDHWGQGIATEAARALLEFAFGTVRLHRIVARCHPDNPASAAVMQKLGMTYEGRQREVMWMKGAWWDFLVYSILEQEFQRV
jgi:RimJ/RimL family protein N-acetyltransferase